MFIYWPFIESTFLVLLIVYFHLSCAIIARHLLSIYAYMCVCIYTYICVYIYAYKLRNKLLWLLLQPFSLEYLLSVTSRLTRSLHPHW